MKLSLPGSRVAKQLFERSPPRAPRARTQALILALGR